MKRYTSEQVQTQRERFENLVKACNLVKAGSIIIRMMLHEKNVYSDSMFVGKYLAMNNICGCMYYKIDPNVFHSDEFRRLAIVAYINSNKPV